MKRTCSGAIIDKSCEIAHSHYYRFSWIQFNLPRSHLNSCLFTKINRHPTHFRNSTQILWTHSHKKWTLDKINRHRSRCNRFRFPRICQSLVNQQWQCPFSSSQRRQNSADDYRENFDLRTSSSNRTSKNRTKQERLWFDGIKKHDTSVN